MADLSDSYGAKIYQLAFRYLRNREDAEEVAQDVLLKVYQKIDAFRGDAALSSWIYRITFNAAMSRLREFKQNLPNALEKTSDEETGQPLKREVVDWAPLADEEMLREGNAAGAGARAEGHAGALSRAGDSSRRAGSDDRRGERRAAREGTDAEVAAASRPADAARAAGRLFKRIVAALIRKGPATADLLFIFISYGRVVNSTVAFTSLPSRRTTTSTRSPGFFSRSANVKS